MKLYFRDRCLGDVFEVDAQNRWWIGRFRPTAEIRQFHEFFAWMADEEKNSSAKPPPFDEAWWTDENWFVEDENHRRRGVAVPTVYEHGVIYLRTR